MTDTSFGTMKIPFRSFLYCVAPFVIQSIYRKNYIYSEVLEQNIFNKSFIGFETFETHVWNLESKQFPHKFLI